MNIYEYLGRNRRGETMRGTVESASPQAVGAPISMLKTAVSPAKLTAGSRTAIAPAPCWPALP